MPIRAATVRRPIAKRSIASATMQDWPVRNHAIVANAATREAMRG